MKKIIFLLLLTVAGYAQQTNFPYGIKNPAATSDSAPSYFVTSQTDNIYKKTPSALVAFKSDLPVSYAIIVYVNDISPLTATIFDDENPPTTNDNAFKADVDNLYIGTDASTWVYNGSTYVTKTIPASSNFKIVGTGVDAGSNKTSSIYREGSISSDAFVSSNAGMFTNRNGSNTAQNGGFYAFSNAAASNIMMFQLNASNGLDLWNYASSTWNKRFTFSSGGDLTANSFIKSGGTNLQYLMADGSVSLGGGGSGDMILASTQTNTGLKTFLNGTLGFRNGANTFTSFFANANTAARTYTLQNRDGTLLDNTDLSTINSSLAAKQNIFTGTTNYLPKSTSPTTLGASRILDDGTFIGIGTANAPTKDLTFGNQSDRKIGIEDSDSTMKGKDFEIKSGRAINFLSTTLFSVLDANNRSYTGTFSGLNGDVFFIGVSLLYKQTGGVGSMSTYPFTGISDVVMMGGCVTVGGDVYICSNTGGGGSGSIYKQTGGVGSFVLVSGTSGRNYRSMCSTPNGDVYASVGGGNLGDIYKQTGGVGSFVAMGFTARSYCIAAAPNGDVYVGVTGGSVYKIASGTSVLTDLVQTNRNYTSIAVSPNSDIFITDGIDVFKKTGSGNFISTGQVARAYCGVSINTNYTLYSTISGGGIYSVGTSAKGLPDLDGGTLKHYAGTGKGTGKSRYEIYTGQKTVSGTDMQIETKRLEIDEDGITKFYAPIRLKNYTVATLPTGTQGDAAYVTDALTPTYLVTVVGGGAVVTPVFYNGTSWVAH